MPCAVSGCDMPTAHHRSFIHYLSVLFPFIPYLPKKEEEDYCVPLECFHVLQMRHKCFEVLLMESEGTHNTCQLASREDGFTYAQASVLKCCFIIWQPGAVASSVIHTWELVIKRTDSSLDLSHGAENDIKRRFSLTLSGLPYIQRIQRRPIFKESNFAVTDLSLLKIKVPMGFFAMIPLKRVILYSMKDVLVNHSWRNSSPKKENVLKSFSHLQAIQDVDEFVFFIRKALHHLLTNGSSAVNGCCQNESPNSL